MVDFSNKMPTYYFNALKLGSALKYRHIIIAWLITDEQGIFIGFNSNNH